MARITRKLNFLIEESICKDLAKLVPSGKRSEVVNEALRKELEVIRRQNAAKDLLKSPIKGERYSTRQIVSILSNARRSH
jgi:Arc/MetJ-type ribon-helix-helix transcriptional regulator